MSEPAESRFAESSDGLRLHYRDVGPADATVLPVVCLPGLTRTTADFDVLADAFAAGEPPRRVISIDYRGRGGSAHDPDPAHYNVMVEAADVSTVLAAAGIAEAVIVGTSRGGLITLVLAALHPALIRGTVLNDIGPVLEPAGLARIRGYVGKTAAPRDWAGAVATIKGYAGAHFTGLSEEDWLLFARTTFVERDGTLAGRYDPELMRTLQDLDLADLPSLWPQFDGLAHAPLLVVRGANSDLLSEETAAEMVRRHPDAALLSVPGQGHAPLLHDAVSLARLLAFARHCDGVHHASPRPSGERAETAEDIPGSTPA